MTIWEQLGIEKTRDKRKIKHAYAKQAAKYHPEEHPEEFKEIYEAYQSALSYATRSEFDEEMDALIFEQLINGKPSSRPPERKKEETGIDFSAFDADMSFSASDADMDVSDEEFIQMRLIDRILRNMQTIIEKPEKNVAWKIAKMYLDIEFDRKLEEWERLLASPGFQEVHNNRNFILRLNKLECISLMSGDMAKCLYRELDFKFIEKNFERADYQELQFRLRQCVDREAKWRQKVDRRASCLARACVVIMFVICVISLVGVRQYEKQRLKLEEKERNEICTVLQGQLREKYHQDFKVEWSRGMWEKYSHLSESLDIHKYHWFSGVVLEGDMAGHECTIAWKNVEGMRDSFAYELIEDYRQKCNAVNDFHCEGRLEDERQYCGYEYKEDGIIYNYPIYDVCNIYKKKRIYSKKQIHQLKEWIHKIQDEDMLFVHTPYIKLLFRGLHREEYVLKLTQDYNEVDYHKLIRKLEQFRWEGKKKKKGK